MDEIKTQTVIRDAHVYMGGMMESSAQHCLDMAMRCYAKDNFEAAHRWAMKSLGYSVGIFHPAYKAAA